MARKSNKIFNQSPRFANFIPADLAIPLIGALGIGLLLNRMAQLPPFPSLAVSAWLGATYWLFVGDRPWQNLSKLNSNPPNWETAQIKYQLPASINKKIHDSEKNREEQDKSRQ